MLGASSLRRSSYNDPPRIVANPLQHPSLSHRGSLPPSGLAALHLCKNCILSGALQAVIHLNPSGIQQTYRGCSLSHAHSYRACWFHRREPLYPNSHGSSELHLICASHRQGLCSLLSNNSRFPVFGCHLYLRSLYTTPLSTSSPTPTFFSFYSLSGWPG